MALFFLKRTIIILTLVEAAPAAAFNGVNNLDTFRSLKTAVEKPSKRYDRQRNG